MAGKWLDGVMGKGEEPELTEFIYVLLPEQVEPDERQARYGDMLDAELRLARLGYVSGGGQLLSAPDEEGEREILYCGIDVDAVDVDAARELLRLHLPELGCPAGTLIEYERGETGLQDEFDGSNWTLAQPRPSHE